MNYIYKKLGGIALVCTFFFISTSCEEEFLSENPTDRLSIEASFNTIESAETGLIGCYSVLQGGRIFNASGYPFYWGDIGVDTFTVFFFNPDKFLHFYDYDAGDNVILDVYTEHYKAIKVVNLFLGKARQLSFETASESTEPTEENIRNFEEVKNRIVAEASFIRAILYFNLVKVWGDVPLNLNESAIADPADEIIPNSPQEVVYQAIERDLLFAERWLDTDVGRALPKSQTIATLPAVRAVLGRVYLQMTTPRTQFGIEGGIDQEGNSVSRARRFEMAAEKLALVVNEGGYSLMPNYSDIFDPSMEQSNTEMIFAVGYDGPGMDEGSSLGDTWGAFGNPPVGAFNTRDIYHEFALSYLEADSLEFTGNNFANDQISNFLDELDSDKRFDLVSDSRFFQNVARINTNFFNNASNDVEPGAFVNNINATIFSWRPYKYKKELTTTTPLGDQSFDYPYIRYADVLLMLAEAYNELGRSQDAINLVNEVRRRAFKAEPRGEGVTIDLAPADMSRENILRLIIRERKWELAFEGVRKDDLIRTGLLTEIINPIEPQRNNVLEVPSTFYQTFKNHWPLPLTELNLNPNLVQNCGYPGGGACN